MPISGITATEAGGECNAYPRRSAHPFSALGGGVRCSFAYAYQKLPARDEEDPLEGMDIDHVFRFAQSTHGE